MPPHALRAKPNATELNPTELGPVAPKRADLARRFSVCLLATFAVAAVMAVLDHSLRNDVARYGIISFELAGDQNRAQDILASWDASARLVAAFSLGLDYLFLVIYPWCLSAGCRWLAWEWPQHRILHRMGLGLALMVWLCAPLDGLENYALWQLLQGASEHGWPQWAYFCALVKFLLLALTLLYLLPLLSWYCCWHWAGRIWKRR